LAYHEEPYPWRENGYTLSASPSPGLLLTAGFLWLEPNGVGVGDQKKNPLLQQHKEYQVQTRNLELRHQ